MEGISIGKDDYQEYWSSANIGLLVFIGTRLDCCRLVDTEWEKDIKFLDKEVPLSPKLLIKW